MPNNRKIGVELSQLRRAQFSRLKAGGRADRRTGGRTDGPPASSLKRPAAPFIPA